MFGIAHGCFLIEETDASVEYAQYKGASPVLAVQRGLAHFFYFRADRFNADLFVLTTFAPTLHDIAVANPPLKDVDERGDTSG
jgi:hypothetical protein